MKLLFLFFCLSAMAVSCPGPATSQKYQENFDAIVANCQNVDIMCTEECTDAVTQGQALLESLASDPTLVKGLECLFDVNTHGNVIQKFIIDKSDGSMAEQVIDDFQKRLSDFNFEEQIAKIQGILGILEEESPEPFFPSLFDMLNDFNFDAVEESLASLTNVSGLQDAFSQFRTDLQDNGLDIGYEQLQNLPFLANDDRDDQGELIFGGFQTVIDTVMSKADEFLQSGGQVLMQEVQTTIGNIPVIKDLVEEAKDFLSGFQNGGGLPNLGDGLQMFDIQGLKDRFQSILQPLGLGGINMGDLQGTLATLKEGFQSGQVFDTLKDLLGRVMNGGGFGGRGFPGAFDPTVLESCAGAPEEVQQEALKLEKNLKETITLEEASNSNNPGVVTVTTNDNNNKVTNNDEASSAAALLPGLAMTLAAAGTTLLL